MLVDQVEAGLEGIEGVAPDRPPGVLVVAAEPDQPGLACLSCLDQGFDNIAFPQDIQAAGVELDQVDVC